MPTGRGWLESDRNHLSVRCHKHHCYLRSASVFPAALWKEARAFCGRTLHNCFKQKAHMWQQADPEWGNKSNRKPISFILSSNYSIIRWKHQQSENWKTLCDETLSVYDTLHFLTSVWMMIIPVTKKLSACNLSQRNPCWLYLGRHCILVNDRRVQQRCFYSKPETETFCLHHEGKH